MTELPFLCELRTKEKQNPFFRCLQASLPVQEYLFMPFDQAHKQYETARHLPPPLYVLFVQATAYGQACGECEAGREEGLWEQRPRPGGTGSTACRGKLPGPAQKPSGDRRCLPSALPSMAALTSWPKAGLT